MKINLLRQKILDLAIRGKLVPQDPNDEPASVLLERIRAEKERLIAEGKIKRPKKSNASSAPSHYKNLEPPFPIPKSWEWVRLEDIAECIVDCPHTTAKDEGHGFALIRTPNVGEGELILRGVHRVSESIYNLRNRRAQPTEGDIIYAREAPAGNAAVVRQEKVCLGQRTVLIKPLKEFCNSEYITFALLAPLSKNRLISKATGSTVQHVNLEDIRPFYIPLPPFEEQVRIVVKLKILLGLLTEASSGLDSLSLLIKSCKYRILDLAMQGKLVPQDPADEPAADMLYRINSKAKIISDNPHSWNIPSSWTWCYLGDIFQHNTGKALNSANKEGIEYEYITTSNVYWGRFVLDDLNKMPFKENEIGKCTTCKGDLLVCEGGDVGRAAIWNFDRNIMIQNHLRRLRPFDGDICTPLYYFVFRLYKDKGLIGGKGIALQGFSSKSLHKLIVPLPPANEETRIVAKIEELFSILDEIEASLQS